jgi:hypothetical protein
MVLLEHDIEHPLILREAVLQGDRFGEHFDALDGIARQIREFSRARQVSVDEHHGRPSLRLERSPAIRPDKTLLSA